VFKRPVDAPGEDRIDRLPVGLDDAAAPEPRGDVGEERVDQLFESGLGILGELVGVLLAEPPGGVELPGVVVVQRGVDDVELAEGGTLQLVDDLVRVADHRVDVGLDQLPEVVARASGVGRVAKRHGALAGRPDQRPEERGGFDGTHVRPDGVGDVLAKAQRTLHALALVTDRAEFL
jgi:hypothetical protein